MSYYTNTYTVQKIYIHTWLVSYDKYINVISSFSAQDANLQPSAKAVRGNIAPAQSGFSSHARASRRGAVWGLQATGPLLVYLRT